MSTDGKRDARRHGTITSHRLVFRSILIQHQFSPITDLVEDEHIPVIALASKRFVGPALGSTRIERMQQAILLYFFTRNEDARVSGQQAYRPVARVHPPLVRHRFYPMSELEARALQQQRRRRRRRRRQQQQRLRMESFPGAVGITAITY
jgi:hypothetical protein